MNARHITAPLVAGILGLAGCQASGPPQWAGTWAAVGGGHGGEIRCIAEPVDDENWKATFTGYCNRQFVYEIEMKGRKQGEKVVFKGEADLGELDGGLYDWSGELDGDVFVGAYASKSGKTGSFRMTRQ